MQKKPSTIQEEKMSESGTVDLNKELDAYITNADYFVDGDETPRYEIDFDPGNYYGKKHPKLTLIELDADALSGTFDIAAILSKVNAKFEDERSETLRYSKQAEARQKRIEKLETTLKATQLLAEAGINDNS